MKIRYLRFLKHLKVQQIVYRLWYIVEVKISWLLVLLSRLSYSSNDIHHLYDNLPQPTFFKVASNFENELPVVVWHQESGSYGARLRNLTLHYMEFLETNSDNGFFMKTIESWIRSNPCYAKNFRLNAWNSYALSIRCVVWMQQYAIRKSHLTDEFKRKFLQSLAEQLEFLLRHLELDIVGNHLIKNIKALLWGGAFFDNELAKECQSKGEKLLCKTIPDQILDDGMHYERSSSYHCQVFADMLEVYEILRSELQQWLAPYLHRMAIVVADMQHPDGKVAQFNDAGLHMAYLPDECLQVYKKIFNKQIKTNQYIELSNAGYFGAHFDDASIIVDCGALSPNFLVAHAHADILSFELSLYGHRVVVDPGVYIYDASRWRQYSRSSLYHNTVTIAQKDYCEFFGSFRMGRRTRGECDIFQKKAEGFYLKGHHKGYQYLIGSPIHQREFYFTNNKLCVVDKITNGNTQKVAASILLHPDCELRQISSHKCVITSKGHRIMLTSSGRIVLRSRWWCPDIGRRLRTTQCIFEYGQAPCEGQMILSYP